MKQRCTDCNGSGWKPDKSNHALRSNSGRRYGFGKGDCGRCEGTGKMEVRRKK